MKRNTIALSAAMLGLFSVPSIAAIHGAPSGTGPFPAVAESIAGLPGHIVYRPESWPKGRLPLFVWGNGGCSDDGLQHAAFLRQIASHGYVVVALGTAQGLSSRDAPPGGPDRTQPAQMTEAIDWAVRNAADRIDVEKIAVGGHSCGGLQALAVSHDPRVRTTLVLNSGIHVDRRGARSGVAIDKSQLSRLHAPLLYLSGGPDDIAHVNAADDVARLDHVPVFFGALPVGHEGTFWKEADGGTWARVVMRWLDWKLKADADASWDFAGPACRLCTDARWTVVQKKLGLPEGPFRESLYVPVRDGTRLAMNVYRPAREGRPVSTPQPVVFAFTPYRARHRETDDGRIAELGSFPPVVHRALLEGGFVLAVADVRGKGASFGTRRGFGDRTEARDGHDLVQWLASRPWSNGRVGMYGCSYLGGTTVHVASTAPPALRAIFTGATDLDKFAFVRNGGITAQFNTRPDEPLSVDLASVPVDTDVDGSMLRAAVAQHAANTPMAELWYGMPFRDSVSPLTGNRFWEEAGPYTYLDALRSSGVATYYWSNWEDEPTGQVILAAHNLGSRLLIGPGTHCVPPPGFDFAGEVRRYFEAHLPDGAPGRQTDVPRATWWHDGLPPGTEWQRGESLPGEGVERRSWYLSRDAALRDRPASRGEARFRVDYDVGDGGYFPFWVESQHGRGSSFATPPLAEDHDLVGFPVVHLEVAADTPEPMLFSYLEEVPPEGPARVLAFGRLAAAYRQERAAPYDTLGLPWHAGLAADHAPLAGGRAVKMRFALTPAARRIPAGHRLRLVITGADPRQRNLASLRIDPPPTITLRFGGRDGARVDLPLRPIRKTPLAAASHAP